MNADSNNKNPFAMSDGGEIQDILEVNTRVSQIIKRIEQGVTQFNGIINVSNFEPIPIPEKSVHPDDILNSIQNAIVKFNVSKDEDEQNLAILPTLHDTEKLSIVSRSVIQYMLCLDDTHSDYFFNWIYTETTNWIVSLFGFPNAGVVYDDNLLNSITNLFQMLLSHKYPNYHEDGFDSLKEIEPVIYYTSHLTSIIAKHICKCCGLPVRCSRKIEIFELADSNGSEILRKIINDDINDNKMPVMLFLEAGTAIIPKLNNIELFRSISKHYGIWLHLAGELLASIPLYCSLICTKTEDEESNRNIADSMTITLGSWLNIPALPSIYSDLGNDKFFLHGHDKIKFGISRANLMQQVTWFVNAAFFVWLINDTDMNMGFSDAKCLGKEDVINRFTQKFDSCYKLYRKIESYPCMSLLSQPPGYGSPNGICSDVSITDFIVKSANWNEISDALLCSVVFQFIPENNNMWSENYRDKLNSWLNQVLSRELPEVRTNVVVIQDHGVALQFSPFESMPLIDDTTWSLFYACLEAQLDILQSTVAQKAILYKLLDESTHLKLVELHDWAGLGGVRYIPQAWDQTTNQTKAELNRLNLQIVEQLRNTDAAFSAGESDDGLVCIRFGMTGSDSDVTDLLSLVENIGKQEEDSWTFIDTMAEVVKKGIETAMLDLQKESEDKLWQEGILRHVPVFGSIVNWWSPLDKDKDTIKGRSLDLNAGVICSTENIYRYHMQSPPTTSPVQPPSVQTPIIKNVVAVNNNEKPTSDSSDENSSVLNFG